MSNAHALCMHTYTCQAVSLIQHALHSPFTFTADKITYIYIRIYIGTVRKSLIIMLQFFIRTWLEQVYAFLNRVILFWEFVARCYDERNFNQFL